MVTHADHIIENEARNEEAVNDAISKAVEENIFTFGIKPSNFIT